MVYANISVVIPCFNEEKRIFYNIQKIHEYLSKNVEAFEIIAVNDGSTDRTLEELQRVQKIIPFSIINNTVNEGKGKAVRDGILASQKEIVMFLDADLGIPIEELEKFLVEIQKGADLVIASRFVPGLKVTKQVVWYRKLMEKIFRLIRMAILNNYDIQDTQCGFKVFKREIALTIFSQLITKRFAFDAEVVFLAKKKGYKIKELPITLQNPADSHVRIYRDSLNMIISLLKIRLCYLAGKYSL